jgi:hypothetical protein
LIGKPKHAIPCGFLAVFVRLILLFSFLGQIEEKRKGVMYHKLASKSLEVEFRYGVIGGVDPSFLLLL